MVYVGIDLGTTYSCVAIIEDRRPRIIYNEAGKDFTPSIAAYGKDEILVGKYALTYGEFSHILYDSKRLIGWKFIYELPDVESRQLWTFNLDVQENSVVYVLKPGLANKEFVTPDEVSSEILKSIKEYAELYTKGVSKITGAVVTIPAFFQDNQREATKRAIEMAGLDLKMLIEEPIAAAIAYNHEKRLGNSTIMIFDFGGGTLDICIAEIIDESLRIKAVKGANLGGQDFDAAIMNFVYKESEESCNNDVSANPRLKSRLHGLCRKAKETISHNTTVWNINLDISGESGLHVPLTREKFNELCGALFTRAMDLIDETLNMARPRLEAKDIDHVILVGGSTRIPAIREHLERKFGNGKLKFDINPEKAVVYGAAIVADALEKGNPLPLINSLVNVSPDKILFCLLYRDDRVEEGRICLFHTRTLFVEQISKFNHSYIRSFNIASTPNKIFALDSDKKLSAMFDLDTRQISEGPKPDDWRVGGSVAYYKDKLYYIGGVMPNLKRRINRVNVFENGTWNRGPDFPGTPDCLRSIICNGKLYVIDEYGSKKVFRLSDDEREWTEMGHIGEWRIGFAVASLDGKLYITGGQELSGDKLLKSCLCFDPSAPDGSRLSQIADMTDGRKDHSLVAANGKLYVIGGFSKKAKFNYSTEEYDPSSDKWKIIDLLDMK